MRHALLSAAAAAALLSAGVGCSSNNFPKSPVAAPLSEIDAARLADAYLDEQDAPDDRIVTSIEPHGYGYFVSYRSDFDAAEEPVAAWHVVDVRNDGKLREVEFRK